MGLLIMPSFNFQKRFVPALEQGLKRSTIRRRPALVGLTAFLFTGLRTKSCTRVAQHTITHCNPITLVIDLNNCSCKIDNRYLTGSQFDLLARQDGFGSAILMLQWLVETYPNGYPVNIGFQVWEFKGYLIKWETADHD